MIEAAVFEECNVFGLQPLVDAFNNSGMRAEVCNREPSPFEFLGIGPVEGFNVKVIREKVFDICLLITPSAAASFRTKLKTRSVWNPSNLTQGPSET